MTVDTSNTVTLYTFPECFRGLVPGYMAMRLYTQKRGKNQTSFLYSFYAEE